MKIGIPSIELLHNLAKTYGGKKMNLLSENLKTTNICKLTEQRIRQLKVSELDLMLFSIPSGYKKAITRLIQDLATNLDPEIKEEKFSSLGQMLEQVIWINMQARVSEKMLEDSLPELLKPQAS